MVLDDRAASEDLATMLGRANAALTRSDTEAANVALAAAADLCRRLQAAGLGVPPSELGVLRDLADRCGVALLRLGQELNAESFRDDNHRRGMRTYGGERDR